MSPEQAAVCLEYVRQCARDAARFPDDFEREFGFPVGRMEQGRQDAYRAILGIIDRHEAMAFHGQPVHPPGGGDAR